MKCLYVFAVFFFLFSSLYELSGDDYCSKKNEHKKVNKMFLFDFLFAVYDDVEYSMCVSGDTNNSKAKKRKKRKKQNTKPKKPKSTPKNHET